MVCQLHSDSMVGFTLIDEGSVPADQPCPLHLSTGELGLGSPFFRFFRHDVMGDEPQRASGPLFLLLLLIDEAELELFASKYLLLLRTDRKSTIVNRGILLLHFGLIARPRSQ